MSSFSRFKSWLNPGGETPAELAPTPGSASTSHGPRLVVGLGNPGKQYERTRHNLGFMVVDELVRRTMAGTPKARNNAAVYETRFASDRLILIKPQTYMNESGKAVGPLMNWYKADPDETLLIVDDLDLTFGQIRIRGKGKPGGHNGLKSVFSEVGTEEIPRLRIGIGRGSHQTIDHVLSRFSPEQEQELPAVIDRAADTVELWLNHGILEAMNLTNGA